MSADSDDLLRLLPAIYRVRDAQLAASGRGLLTPAEAASLAALAALPNPTRAEQEQLAALREKASRGPLAALLTAFAGELATVEENLAQLYDDLFIETCADWAIPYIGDLIGYEPLHGLGAVRGLARAEVAHSIALRRRKGTAAALEQLARNVTGWNARAVELFQRLSATQYMNHPRPHSRYAPDLRLWEPLARIGTAFESVAHTVDVRRIESGRGRFNIPNVGIFLWRLDAYRHTRCPALDLGDGRYLVSPLRHPLQLYTKPRPEDEIAHLAEPINVPDPIGRRMLHEHLAQYYGTRNEAANEIDNADPSIVIYEDGDEVPRSAVVVCNLADRGAVWAHMPPAGHYAIDPVLGRIALTADAKRKKPQSLQVTYHYGFSAQLGGGEYDRERQPERKDATVVQVPGPHPSIQAALNALGGNGIVEVTDSARYEETLRVEVSAGGHVTLRAAQGCWPTLVLTGELVVTAKPSAGGEPGGTFALEGLLVVGDRLRVPDVSDNALSQLRIAHATLVPGLTLDGQGEPVFPGAASLVVERPGVAVALDHAILGALRVAEGASLKASDCVIDATAPTGIAYCAPNDPNPTEATPGGELSLEACTVIGKIGAQAVGLVSNSLLIADAAPTDALPPVYAARRQTGCVRFSFLPFDSLVPRRHRCQPADAATEASLFPRFTSLRYGVAAYGQLAHGTPVEIRRGADDEGEMGAFHSVFAAQRENNLQVRLREFLPVGLSAGIFHET
jgi:hypothetical protein